MFMHFSMLMPLVTLAKIECFPENTTPYAHTHPQMNPPQCEEIGYYRSEQNCD
jgi:hypothetical protein